MKQKLLIFIIFLSAGLSLTAKTSLQKIEPMNWWVGMKNQARVNLKINEPEGSTRAHDIPRASDAESAVDEVMEELKGE